MHHLLIVLKQILLFCLPRVRINMYITNYYTIKSSGQTRMRVDENWQSGIVTEFEAGILMTLHVRYSCSYNAFPTLLSIVVFYFVFIS
jgi:hypothetical protein